MNNLKTLCSIAIKAAKAAGTLIADYDKSGLEVNSKEGGSSLASQVVTEVDLLAQVKILEIINPTLKQYDLALLTEESVDDKSRFDKNYFWCIDPLDGTLPFIESTPGYSVSIALVSKEGIPQLGVIYDPLKLKCYSAIRGEGALLDGEPFSTARCQSSSRNFTLVNDRSLKKHPRFQEVIEKMNPEKRSLHGGAAMNAIWVIQNSPAAYFKFPKPEDGGGSLWDYAAGSCIVKEAGGFASDIYGNPLDLNRDGSTFMNHRGILIASGKNLAQEIKEKFGY